MTEPACGPFTDGYIVGQHDLPILPEAESFVKYREDGCLGDRPRREAVREEIADFILLTLGAPRVRVELDRQQLSLCVDEAMKRYERHAPKSDFENFYFNAVPGQNRYKLPCDIGFIRRVDFGGVGACGGGGMGAGGGIFSIGAPGLVVPFAGAAYYASGSAGGGFGYGVGGGGLASSGTGLAGGSYSGGMAGLGDWVLMQQYFELFQRIFSGDPKWEIASENTILITPTPRSSTTVIVNYLQRKKDWGEAEQWIKDWALAHAKEILGRIRSKFDRYVSPGGGVTLDGDKLLQESQEAKTYLEESARNDWSMDHMLPTLG